ncbi:AAA family ATPase [Streptomyces sp. GC420]|uniref:AAA family ATPase n=1 Tax=Streptomyces sp. GC420 TaxID=2697568 RepID=UPI001414FFB2|nr:LuxR family transcriptional regulator [Streptomyces sp. GC420]NBM19245.1 AAA family ATPase [Streptomyces sp. GC420]
MPATGALAVLEGFDGLPPRDTELYEREGQLSLLHNLLQDSLRGNTRLAVVTGAAGHGKTELLDAFAAQAQRLGVVHIAATASRAEQPVPFGVLAQLFQAVDLPQHIGTRVSRLLGQVMGSGGSATPDEPGAIPPRLFHQMGTVLHDLVELSQPLLISVDDVQYADAPSLLCLSTLARRRRTTPLLLVLSEHPSPLSASVLLNAELPPEPLSHRVLLPPLSRGGVRAMLATRLGESAASRLADDCLAVTGGNPLLVRRLIEDTAARGEPFTLHADRRFEQAVLDCLYRCDPYVRTVARQMAVLDDPEYTPLLYRLSDVDPRCLSLTLGVLEETGLLADGAWRHPQAVAAVLHEMTTEERATLHTRTGTLLFKNGAPVTAVARQLVAASRIDNDCAASVLLEAAEEGLATGDTALASNCLSIAYQYGRSEQHRATTTAMLFRTEWRADPRTAARRIPTLVEAAREGHLSGRHVSAPVDALLWFGRPEAALDALERMERHAWQRQDVEASAHLQTRRAALGLLYPATTVHGDGDGASTPVLGEDCTRWAFSRSQVLCELFRVLQVGPNAPSTQTAEQTLVSHQLTDETVPSLAAAIDILLINARHASAERWIDTLVSVTQKQSAPAWHALFTSLRARLALQRGNPAKAARLAEAALAEIPTASWGVMIGLPLSVALEAHTLLGACSAALALLHAPIPDAMFQTPLGLRYLHARGRALLGNGQSQAALDDFLAVGELARLWRMDVPAVLPWRTDAALVHLLRGDTERARELATEQLGLVRQGQHQVRAVTLRVLAATASTEERGKLLGRALEEAQQCGNPVVLAYTLHEMGRCDQEAGQYSKGRMALLRARQLAEECGVQLPARTLPEAPRGQQPPSVVGGSDELVGMLSDAEMRVVALAVRGLSNRQIAAKLFVTVSTVEQHLTRVYRKLGIKRRSDLTLALHGGTPSAAPPGAGSAGVGDHGGTGPSPYADGAVGLEPAASGPRRSVVQARPGPAGKGVRAPRISRATASDCPPR